MQEEMVRRGWCQTSVPEHLLEELEIRHEVMCSPLYRKGPGRMAPDAVVVYAPAWVLGVWRRSGHRCQSDILKARLSATRDDSREQEMVSRELSLDLGVGELVREAANNYRYKRQG